MAVMEKSTSEASIVGISGGTVLLFAGSVATIVANLPAPQTLVGLIETALRLNPDDAGLMAMATQFGYAIGLFLLVPLADLLENRKLMLGMLLCSVLAAIAVTVIPNVSALIVALFILGAACSAIQILVPIAASMAPPEQRGRVIGDIVGGLMAGMLLSRPLASFTADIFGTWRAFYGVSAVAMALLTVVLALRLPRRSPTSPTGYPALIASLWLLLRSEPTLRRSALTASLATAAFSLFWTSVALRLTQSPFNLGQGGIALFALAGIGGALATPFAGRAADRGWSGPAKTAFHLAIVAAYGLAACAGSRWMADSPLVGLGFMGASAILLDSGVTGEQTVGRYAVNLLQPEVRGRLNALFVGLFMLGGAIGSALAGLTWSAGRWPLICSVGAAIGAAALLLNRIMTRSHG